MASTPASAPSTKKSFFKRPAWATSTPSTQSGDFFRHADTVYDSILRDKERRRERHAQKKKDKINRTAEEEGRESKKRRISFDEDAEDRDSRSESESAGTGKDEGQGQISDANTGTDRQANGAAKGARPSSPKATIAPKPGTAAQSAVILLGSDEDEPVAAPIPEKTLQKETSDEEVSEEEDAYVIALKRKAREKARVAKESKDVAVDPKQISPAPGLQQEQQPQQQEEEEGEEEQQHQQQSPLRSFPDDHPTKATSPTAPLALAKKDETIVQILINPKIPNTKPLLVNRKVSQPLQQVREVWCARQNFDKTMTAKVVFAWRGKRLYDTTTSTHLLNVLRKERARENRSFADDSDNEDPSYGRIEVEALTKEMYEQRLERRTRESADPEANGEIEPDDGEGRSTEPPQEPSYKIVLKAQGLEPLPLKVRPSTVVSKMMSGFRKMRRLDPDKTCWLVFDGERLEPDSTIRDAEIEDGDAVEVHVR